MSRRLEDDLMELDDARAGALWPWMLFSAALVAAIALFFVLSPR